MDISVPKNLMGSAGESVGGAMMNFGESVSRAGNAAATYLDNIQKNYDYNDAVEMGGGWHIESEELAAQFTEKDDGSDPDALKKYQDEQRKIDEKYIAKAGEKNQRVSLYMEKYIGVHGIGRTSKVHTALMTNFMKRSMKVDGDQAQISIGAALDAEGDTFQNVQNAINDNKVKIESRQSIYGSKWKNVFDGAIATALENNLELALKDPAKSRTVINMMKDDAAKDQLFGYLTPEGKIKIQGMLKASAGDTLRQDAYTSLYEKYGGDWNAMNEALSKPSIQKELGLGMEDAFYVKAQISAAQVDEEKATAKLHDQTASEVFLNMKSMTPGKIDMLVKSGKLDYKLGEHFKDELKQMREGVSDHNTYFRLYSQVKSAAGDPDAIIKARQSIFASGGLSFSDKKALLALTEGSEDKYEAGITKQGADYIKSVVMPSQTMISAAKPKEAEHYLDAMREYNDAVGKARDKSGKLDADTVNKIAKEVAANHIMSLNDQMDAVKDQFSKNKKKTGTYKGKKAYTFDEITFYDAQTGQVIK